MSEQIATDPYANLERDPTLVGQEQVRLADEWARVYANPDQEIPDRSAEIILRNPSVYLHSVNLYSLPEDLRVRWENTLQFAEALSKFGSTVDHTWNPTADGLEKIQNLVASREMNPQYRGTVSDLMRISSALFAESSQHHRGDTKYYAGNIRGAASWLNHAVR